jgi:hypothetical protein
VQNTCYQVTSKSFKFAEKNNLPFFFVSASDGTNVVKIFQTAILEGEAAWGWGGCSQWSGAA